MTQISPQKAKAPFILSLDVGTSSARAVLFDARGNSLAGLETRQEYQIPVGRDGTVEADADHLLTIVFNCLDELLSKAGALQKDIAAVAGDTFVSNLLGVDAEGQAVTPLMLYSDTRPTAEIEILRTLFVEETIHQRTGCHFHTSYLPARFLWLAHQHPDQLQRAARWMSLAEYLALRLFGEVAVSYSVASWTGLLDQEHMAWDQDLLARLPITAAQLSPLRDVDEPFRGLRDEFARRWPGLAQVPWFPMIGDGAAANVGSGCAGAGRVAVSMGTSSAVRVVVSEAVPPVPAGLWRYRVNREDALIGGAMSEGGSIYAWLNRLLNLADLTDAEAALASRPADGHGLTFLPLISGERSPGWVAEARGAITGLSLATGPLDILQAGMEAVVLRIVQIYNRLAPLLPEKVDVIASGGAFQHSDVWLGMLADALGLPVTIARVAEPSARGAALLGLKALDKDKFQALDSSLGGKIYSPDMRRHAKYQQAILRQQALYEKIIQEK
jgi:gluconokinase